MNRGLHEKILYKWRCSFAAFDYQSVYLMYEWRTKLLTTHIWDMAKVGGPLSVVKVCTSMLRTKIWYR